MWYQSRSYPKLFKKNIILVLFFSIYFTSFFKLEKDILATEIVLKFEQNWLFLWKFSVWEQMVLKKLKTVLVSGLSLWL